MGNVLVAYFSASGVTAELAKRLAGQGKQKFCWDEWQEMPSVNPFQGGWYKKDNATVENYLHEAALVKNAPSGNIYKNGNGKKVTNLGVHEHWNNPASKKYIQQYFKKYNWM